jgi:hypothetical protein
MTIAKRFIKLRQSYGRCGIRIGSVYILLMVARGKQSRFTGKRTATDLRKYQPETLHDV